MTVAMAESEVRLDGPGWVRHGATHARGYAHLDARFLDAAALAERVEGCETDDAWAALLPRLNGCFALVSERGDRVLAAVDRLRSIPLFHAVPASRALVGDDASWIAAQAGDPPIDEEAEEEFLLTGYVTGAGTLRREVRQLEAGTWLRWPRAAPAPSIARYHAFAHRDFLAEDTDTLVERLAALHERVFRRLLESVAGRPIVVPLSGGYDSRLIGVSLRDLGARDVLCYSYGVPGNWESRISKELADHLGFRWTFVPYDHARWRAWAATPEFAGYLRTAGNLASVPHVQDWPAVRELTGQGIVEPGSAIVPGHSGDFLAGSHIPKAFVGGAQVTRRDVLDAIQSAHYSLRDWPERAGVRERVDRRIEAIVGPVADGTPEQAADVFERWDLQERQAKFICNAVRVYEQFGCEWRLPLFDAELMDFWARIPVDLRVGRALYFAFVERRQSLPITPANTDYGRAMRTAVRTMDALRLRPLAYRARRALRRARWRHAYASAPLAWTGLVDPDEFGRSYTGREIMHSYMAVRCLDALR